MKARLAVYMVTNGGTKSDDEIGWEDEVVLAAFRDAERLAGAGSPRASILPKERAAT